MPLLSLQTSILKLERLAEAKKRRKSLASLEKDLTLAAQRFFVSQRVAYLKALSPQLESLREAFDPTAGLRLFDIAVRGPDKAFTTRLAKGLATALLLGADQAIVGYSLGISFTLKNELAIAFLKDRAAERVTLINETTKEGLKTLLTEAAERGASPQEIARLIRERFEGFSKLPVRGPTHIRTRAELVAVTELAEAYQTGNYLAVKSTGLDFEKAWLTVADSRVSPGCEDNAGKGWIDLEDSFPSGHNTPPRFPGCRCSTQYRPKE